MSFITNIREEIKLVKERDPAIKTAWEVLLYPSFRAILSYKLAHRLYQGKHYFMARLISQRAVRKTGIEIHPGATIGKRLFMDHGNGVVIGETAILGDDVTLYQGVTLGGTGKETGKRHPTIGNNVMISAGAKIIGSFTIGDNSKIGAGSVVLAEIPPNSTVVGVPGRVVKQNNIKISQEDKELIKVLKPVRSDLIDLKEENQSLKQRIVELEAKLKSIMNINNQGDMRNELEFRCNVFDIFEEAPKTAC